MREKDLYRENLMMLREAFPHRNTLTVNEVADWLSVTRRTVEYLIEKNRLPAINVGKGKYNIYRVTLEALARFSS